MSDVPVLNRRNQGLSEESLQHIEAVAESLSAFNEHVSFIGEKLNDIKQSTATGRDAGGGDTSTIQKSEETLRHDKVQPRRNSLLQYGGAIGAVGVFLADMLKKSSAGEDKSSGFMEKALGAATGRGIAGMAGKLFPTLMKALPLAALAGGILWGVVDAIKASILAQEWGVDKISAAIGGFFGGTDKGFKNAFKGAGKWALIGAGIGSVVPVIGTLAGGLVGAALGALMGFIGGEKIAQWVQAAKDKIVDLFNNLGPEAKKSFKKAGVFAVIGAGIGSTVPVLGTIVGGLAGAAIGALIGFFGDNIAEWVTKAVGATGNFIEDMVNKTVDLAASVWTWARDLFMDFFVGQKDEEGKRTKKSILRDLIGFMKDLGSSLMNTVSEFFGGLFRGLDDATGGRISGALEKASQAYEWVQEHIIGPVKNFFSNLGENISNAWGEVKDFVSSAISSVTGFFREYLIWPIRDFFSNIGGFFNAFRDKSFMEVVRMLASQATGGKAIQEDIAGQKEETVRDTARKELGREATRNMSVEDMAEALRDRGIWVPNIQSIDDAIITPKGDIVRTDPEDFIYAAKNLSTLTESESSAAIEDIQRSQLGLQQQSLNRMDQLIATLQQGGRGGEAGNVVQTNITSRYSPINIMNTLTATGEV